MSDDDVMPVPPVDLCLQEMASIDLGPTGSPCLICGNDPDCRHRIWDAIAERWCAGETICEIAMDYVDPEVYDHHGHDAIMSVLLGQAIWLMAEARWWAEELRRTLLADMGNESALDFWKDPRRPFPWEQEGHE